MRAKLRAFWKWYTLIAIITLGGRALMPWNEVMSKWKAGTLQSGSGGKVKGQKQAIAIMLSEKRKAKAGKKEYKAKGVPLSSMRRAK